MGPAVLCIENSESHFVASDRIYGAGTYEMVTATSAESARVALRCIHRIRAVVLPTSVCTPDQQSDLATRLDEVRPGLPKLVLCPPPPPPLGVEMAGKFCMCFINNVGALTRELDRLILPSNGDSKEVQRGRRAM